MLCFNNQDEASSFLQTLGYTVSLSETTGQFEISKTGEASDVWKPRTNYKYIEAKKVEGEKINSRADIIRGVTCCANTYKVIQPAPLLARAASPKKRKSSVEVAEIAKKRREEEQMKIAHQKEEADKTRREERAKLEQKLK